ncbi:MAG TPA: hypothetical protein EYP74_04935 [Anaerolineales bacterium]|nr:hypothetical protein [Anaerolineales bacterium]
MKKILLVAYCVSLSFLLAACANLPALIATPVTSTPIATEITELPPTEGAEKNPAENNSPKILRVWLPPQFNPAAETEAGALLRARLASFQKRRPDITLEIRIKAESGEASLLNSLIVTQKAAPSNMPDLVALRRPNLESAVQAGILYPIDGLTDVLDAPDWFPYARSLAHIQNSAYGLPFAANLLGLSYKPSEDFPLPSFEELEITFPANSPKAELSFCFYDEENIEEESLTDLFSLYQSDTFSPKSAEYQNTNEILESPAVIWSSDFLDDVPADAIFSIVPNPNGDACSLADAWLWTLAGGDPEIQLAAIELAEYLSQSDFLSAWTASLNLLPPRPTALDESETLLHELSLIAQPIPSNETVEILGEMFRLATMSVIQDQADPRSTAQEMLEKLQ